MDVFTAFRRFTEKVGKGFNPPSINFWYDYRVQCWGHACSLEVQNDKFPYQYYGHIFSCVSLHVGDILLLKGKVKAACPIRITKLEWVGDPRDMWWFHAESVTDIDFEKIVEGEALSKLLVEAGVVIKEKR